MAADRLRDEAERLVAAALAAVSSAARGLGTPGAGFATGSAECCVCPVCRAIAAMRDPSPDLADRLAGGVGDLANGVAAILRALSTRGGRDETPEDASSTAEGDQFWEDLRRKAADAAKAYVRPPSADTPSSTMDDDPWRVATREPEGEQPPETSKPVVPRPARPKKAATKAVAKKSVAKKTTPTDSARQ